MHGVTTHISAPKSNTNWATDLKKNLDTRSLAPSLLRILGIFSQTIRALARFCTTVGQLSSATYSTLPSYLKYGTIYRGSL